MATSPDYGELQVDTVDDRILTDEEHFNDVKSAVLPLLPRWQFVANVLLGIESTIKDAVSPNRREQCMDDDIHAWLRRAYDKQKYSPPTWKKLILAVADKSGGDNPAYAMEIARAHPMFLTTEAKVAQKANSGLSTTWNTSQRVMTVSIPVSPVIPQYAKYLQSVHANTPLTYRDELAPDISTDYFKLALVMGEKVKNQKEANEITRLTLQGDVDVILQKKKPIEMDDIFKPDNDKRVRFVVVEGAPGIGKSTFALELCRQWPTRESLQCFSLVILLKLRDKKVRLAEKISDLFWGGENHDPISIYEEVSKENGKCVLFVMDGFDEYPTKHRESSESPIMKLLPGTEDLPEATILLTTRPSVKEALQPFLQHKSTRHIEIVGFGEEEIQKRARSVFGKGSDLLTRFNEYLSSNPVVKSMMYNPLNCSIITKVYYNAASESDRPILCTQTQLYTEMLLWRLSRFLRKCDCKAKIPSNISEVPHNSDLYQQVVKKIKELPIGNDLFQQLVKIGELAFEGKQKEKIIYDDGDIPSGFQDLGLLEKHRATYGRSENTTYNFFHLTMQEYMSAFYIAQLPPDKQKSLYRERSDSMNVVWRFVAGLTKMKGIEWDEVYEMKVSSGIRRELLEYVFEAQDNTNQTLKGCFNDSSPISCAPSTISNYTAFALGYCVSVLGGGWILRLSYLSEMALKMLVSGMECCENNGGYIVELHLPYSKEIMSGENHLICIPPRSLKYIKLLDLLDCGMDCDGFDNLVKYIPHLSSLITLDICGNPGCSGRLQKLMPALKEHKKLESLTMSLEDIHEDDTKALLELVRSEGCCLRELKLYCTQEGQGQRIVELLLSPSSLQSVYLFDITKELLDVIPHLSKNITDLYLHEITPFHVITDGTNVSNIIRSNTSLKVLTLAIPLSKDGLRTILRSLEANTTLERLRFREKYLEFLSEHEQAILRFREQYSKFLSEAILRFLEQYLEFLSEHEQAKIILLLRFLLEYEQAILRFHELYSSEHEQATIDRRVEFVNC